MERDSMVKALPGVACQFCRIRKLKCDKLEPQCSECLTRELKCMYIQRPKKPRPSNNTIHALEEENRRLREIVKQHSSTCSPPLDSPGGQTTPWQSPNTGSTQQQPFPLPNSHQGASRSSESDAFQSQTTQWPKSTFSSPQDFGNNYHGANVGPLSYGDASPVNETSSHSQMEKGDVQESESRLQISSTGRSSYHGPTSTLFDTDSRTKSTNNILSGIPTEWLRSSLVAATLRQRQKEPFGAVSGSYDFDGWDAGLVLHLLNIHWNRQHHNLLIVYRPAFMRDMSCSGPYFSKLLLNAILFAASKFSPRVDIRKDPNERSTGGWRFRQRFKELLGEAMDESTIPTIQALITVASSLFAIGDRRPTSWLYSGTAFRMIVDLGLHADGAELLKQQKLSIEDLEIRRRVFWGAFVFDKIHSMYQGRPVTLQERDMQVPIVFLDDFEELERWIPLEELNYVSPHHSLPKHPGCPTHSVTTFAAFCRLSLIMNRTLNHIYAEKAFRTDEEGDVGRSRMLDYLCSLDNDLNNWLIELQPWLKYEPWATKMPTTLEETPSPSILSLHCMYHIFVILVHRPYLSRGCLYPPEVASNCLFRCTKAALRIAYIVQTYATAFTVERSPYFIAYAAYVACTILIRLATYQQPTCNSHKGLYICREFLRENEKINAGVKRANFVIGSLLKGTTLKVGHDLTCDSSPLSDIISDEIEISSGSISNIVDSFSILSRNTEPSTSINRPIHGAAAAMASADQNSFSSTEASGAPQFNGLFQGASQGINRVAEDLGRTTMGPSEYHDPDGFNDMIFGLHGSGFLDSWPEFTDLENLQST